MRSSMTGQVVALYPSPAGATESELDLFSWTALCAANPVLERLEAQEQPGPSVRCTFDDVLGVDRVQRGEAGRHRQHVLAERRAVHDGAVHLVEDGFDDVRLRDDGADGDVSARQRLGHGDDVGDDVPLLEGEQRAGSSEPRLDLVDGEERAVPVAQVGGFA